MWKILEPSFKSPWRLYLQESKCSSKMPAASFHRSESDKFDHNPTDTTSLFFEEKEKEKRKWKEKRREERGWKIWQTPLIVRQSSCNTELFNLIDFNDILSDKSQWFLSENPEFIFYDSI